VDVKLTISNLNAIDTKCHDRPEEQLGPACRFSSCCYNISVLAQITRILIL